MNVLIVGDRPGPNTDPKDPLFIHTSTGAAARLADLMGLDAESYHTLRRINARHDGEKLLEPAEAKMRFQGILMGLEGSWLVLLIGGEAAKVQGGGLLQGNPAQVGDHRFLFVPHTSGVNRVWNVPENRDFYAKLIQAELSKISG